MGNSDRLMLAGTIVASIAILALGGWLTSLGLGPWYESLTFPPFQPPSWLFTPIWTIVMGLLALATWLVWRNSEDSPRASALCLALYGAQCILNPGWSLLFFGLKRPDVALWAIVALDAVLLLMVVCYRKVNAKAGNMLVPYFVWLLFATAINWWIVSHNSFGAA